MIGIVESIHVENCRRNSYTINLERERIDESFHCVLSGIDKVDWLVESKVNIDSCLHTCAIRVDRNEDKFIWKTDLRASLTVAKI